VTISSISTFSYATAPIVVTAERIVENATLEGVLPLGAAGAGAGVGAGAAGAGGGDGIDAGATGTAGAGGGDGIDAGAAGTAGAGDGDGIDAGGVGAGTEIELDEGDESAARVAAPLMRMLPTAGMEPLEPAV